MIRAVAFDIGQTLVFYPVPLNWSKLYRPAFENAARKLGIKITEDGYARICEVLAKYNTRTVPREKECSSDTIFTEILSGTGIPLSLMRDIEKEFYSFFRTDTEIYPEAEETLIRLKEKGIPTATLSDVAYGMDNEYALEDIGPLIRYIDLPYTSNDIGYRKPRKDGLVRIAKEFGIDPSELAFVGDEEKDIECARNAGSVAVLINRTEEEKDFGQDIEIRSLSELLRMM